MGDIFVLTTHGFQNSYQFFYAGVPRIANDFGHAKERKKERKDNDELEKNDSNGNHNGPDGNFG